MWLLGSWTRDWPRAGAMYHRERSAGAAPRVWNVSFPCSWSTLPDWMGTALLGGALIGLAAAGLLVLTGKTAGVSGIVDGVLRGEKSEWGWKEAFLAGLVAGGLLLAWRLPSALADAPPRSWPLVIAGGLLVGFGARLGGGCTSGHGVCGIGRGSLRGLVGTVLFIAAGTLTVLLIRELA